MDDFNSSDIEYDHPLPKTRPRGQLSIQKIIENASGDRINSKKAVKQLQFGSGAPGTMSNQDLWVQRFNAFRQHTLRQRLDTPFTGDDLIRFFDSTVGKVEPGFTAKPAPSKSVFVKALTILADYGTFTYPQATGYQLTARDSKRITVWFDDAVKAGKLTKGLWQKRVWIGIFVLSRMAKAWLDHHTKYGAVNWDITIARLLGVVLTASIGGRCGDVARTCLYKGAEYMQYRPVELMVAGDREARIDEPDATRRESCEKATDATMNLWPSSVCKHGLQFLSIIGLVEIHLGSSRMNSCRVKL